MKQKKILIIALTELVWFLLKYVSIYKNLTAKPLVDSLG